MLFLACVSLKRGTAPRGSSNPRIIIFDQSDAKITRTNTSDSMALLLKEDVLLRFLLLFYIRHCLIQGLLFHVRLCSMLGSAPY